MLKRTHPLIKGFFWIIVFMLFASLVFGVKDSSEGGLLVVYPQNNFFKLDSVGDLNFKVFNSSNVPVVSSCDVLVYDSSGVGVSSSLGVSSYVNLTSVVDSLGVYSLMFNCSGGGEFGFVVDSFEVTVDGFESSANWLAFLFIFAVIGFGMLFVAFSVKSKGLKGVKLLSFLYGIVNILLLGVMSYFVSIHPSRLHFLKGWAISYISVTIIVLMAIIWLYMVFLTTKVFKRGVDDE